MTAKKNVLTTVEFITAILTVPLSVTAASQWNASFVRQTGELIRTTTYKILIYIKATIDIKSRAGKIHCFLYWYVSRYLCHDTICIKIFFVQLKKIIFNIKKYIFIQIHTSIDTCIFCILYWYYKYFEILSKLFSRGSNVENCFKKTLFHIKVNHQKVQKSPYQRQIPNQ